VCGTIIIASRCTMQRIDCVRASHASVGWPAGRFFHSFFLMSARRLRSMCVCTYIHLVEEATCSKSGRSRWDMRPRTSEETAPVRLSTLPILRDYLSDVSQQPLILTGNELRTLNIAFISILRVFRYESAFIQFLECSSLFQWVFFLFHSCLPA